MNISKKGNQTLYRPVFYRLSRSEERADFERLINFSSGISVFDEFLSQYKEWIKCKHPSKRFTAKELEEICLRDLGHGDYKEFGVWVFYPWSGRLVHIIEQSSFFELRTNRNQYKITGAEQQALSTKKIGIIGLSVGQTIALTAALERICGEIRLADFDELELSNLNRIRAGLHNLGLNKCIVVAREISEIDPFIEVKCFTEGLTEDNMDDFFVKDGKLDLVLDECDGLDIKILCREKARSLNIPVVMDTSDRGMIDVERFDLEPQRELLHGLVGDISPASLKSLSNEEKIPMVLRMVGVADVSTKGKASMIEVGQSISTWPQLASSVVLGSGATVDVCRRILIGQFNASGRYYMDVEDIICDNPEEAKKPVKQNPYQPLSLLMMEAMASQAVNEPLDTSDKEDVRNMVAAAGDAPSTGNDQPWKWLMYKGHLLLFHDAIRSFSFGDFQNIASHLSLGAAYENLVIRAHALGYGVRGRFFPLGFDSQLTAVVELSKGESHEDHQADTLNGFIATRCTNRNPSVPNILTEDQYNALQKAAQSIPGATLTWVTNREEMMEVGSIIGECDRIRIFNPEGHTDFVSREMRWTPEDALLTRDGIDTRTLGMSTSLLSALSVIRDWRVISELKRINGGSAFVDVARKTVHTSSCLGLITLPNYNPLNFFKGGRSLQRLWLMAEKMGLALHPLISPFYLFPRILHGNGEGLSDEEIHKLHMLRERFTQVVPLDANLSEVFLFKLAYAPVPEVRTLRKPVDSYLFFSA